MGVNLTCASRPGSAGSGRRTTSGRSPDARAATRRWCRAAPQLITRFRPVGSEAASRRDSSAYRSMPSGPIRHAHGWVLCTLGARMASDTSRRAIWSEMPTSDAARVFTGRSDRALGASARYRRRPGSAPGPGGTVCTSIGLLSSPSRLLHSAGQGDVDIHDAGDGARNNASNPVIDRRAGATTDGAVVDLASRAQTDRAKARRRRLEVVSGARATSLRLTTPSTLPSAATTGTLLTPVVVIRSTASARSLSGPTVRTRVVMTSSTYWWRSIRKSSRWISCRRLSALMPSWMRSASLMMPRRLAVRTHDGHRGDPCALQHRQCGLHRFAEWHGDRFVAHDLSNQHQRLPSSSLLHTAGPNRARAGSKVPPVEADGTKAAEAAAASGIVPNRRRG